jgi:shikimate dehydrogenase
MRVSAEARIGGATHVVGIVGWPVEHSLSPAIHNAAFAAAGLDWVYVPLPVPPERLHAALHGLAPLGFSGANVTMPHKTEAAGLIDHLSDDAKLLSAVNTIIVRGDELEGHNTDVAGFDRFLRRDAGFDPAGKSALVYGAGGAARACALALGRGGLDHLTVVARAPGRAAPLESIAERVGLPVTVLGLERTEALEVDLVVNATPVGTDSDMPFGPAPTLRADVVVVDLLYDPPVTALQRRAREAGATPFSGLGHLLEQAGLSFELWTGAPAPLDVMSAAAISVLAER